MANKKATSQVFSLIFKADTAAQQAAHFAKQNETVRFNYYRGLVMGRFDAAQELAHEFGIDIKAEYERVKGLSDTWHLYIDPDSIATGIVQILTHDAKRINSGKPLELP